LPTPLIHATDVCYRAQQKLILDHVSLSVHRGEIVSLIGPNGAGKTTLLRLLLGTYRPSHGSIEKAPNLRIGYVPQKPEINPNLPMPVRSFLQLGNQQAWEEDLPVLEETRIHPLLDRSLHQLSGGEFQRVLLARALLRQPDLLVLDEPVQGVDVQGQAQLYHYLAQVHDRMDCGILLVSHDLHFVMASTDRVVCLNRHVCCSGNAEQVRMDENFQALFGPKATAFLAHYTHEHDHSHGHVEPTGGDDG